VGNSLDSHRLLHWASVKYPDSNEQERLVLVCRTGLTAFVEEGALVWYLLKCHFCVTLTCSCLLPDRIGLLRGRAGAHPTNRLAGELATSQFSREECMGYVVPYAHVRNMPHEPNLAAPHASLTFGSDTTNSDLLLELDHHQRRNADIFSSLQHCLGPTHSHQI
jgi:hypothetical protein